MNSLTINYLTHRVDSGGTYFRYHNLAVALTQLGHKVTVFSSDATPGAKIEKKFAMAYYTELSPIPIIDLTF
jgi:hypothetical protein